MFNTASALPLASSPSLDGLTRAVAHDMDAVNTAIAAHRHSAVPLIPQLIDHLINAGGKRLRPMLTLAMAQLLGYDGRAHIDLAAAVEFIHTATLLHDDVVDASDLRRGKQTANKVWGNKASILVGDFLFSRAFTLMVKSNNINVLEVLSHASAVIAEGEVMQLAATRNVHLTEDGYFQLIDAKTAALFAAATEVSAWLAHAQRPIIDAAHRFGKHLGIAFQLVDDILDYKADVGTLGKAIGDDFRDGKVTLPVIYAFQHGNASEQAFWQGIFAANATLTDTDLHNAQRILEAHNAFDYALNKARTHAHTARNALLCLPAHPIRDALDDAIAFTLHRLH